MKLCFVFAVLLATLPAHSTNTENFASSPVDEYFNFTIPGLLPIGNAYASWFFIRDGHIWMNDKVTDLTAMQWPSWNKDQIPHTLAPAVNQTSHLILLDEQKKMLKETELSAPFSIEAFAKKEKLPVRYYQLRNYAEGNQIEVTSPVYEWQPRRTIARCEVDVSGENFDISKSNKMKVCLETVRAYLSDDSILKKQVFVEIHWPKFRDRESTSAAQGLERDIRAAARKAKVIYLAEKIAKSVFTAEIGLTQMESLPNIGFKWENLGPQQGAAPAPDTREIRKVLYTYQTPDGASLVLTAMHSDRHASRRFISPILGRYRVTLQLTPTSGENLHATSLKPENPSSPIHMQQTRDLEDRTGVPGAFRNWQAMVSGGYNMLTSNRGETVDLIGLPRFDARYNSQTWGLIPYGSFEQTFLKFGSTLEISELRAGLQKKLAWVPGLYASAGLYEYSLSGINPGTTRLGSLSALSLGTGAVQKFENWIFHESAEMLVAQSMSFSFRLEAGKMIRVFGSDRVYVGAYAGHSNLQAQVRNKIQILETFTESRLQAGLSIGWVGLDF